MTSSETRITPVDRFLIKAICVYRLLLPLLPTDANHTDLVWLGSLNLCQCERISSDSFNALVMYSPYHFVPVDKNTGRVFFELMAYLEELTVRIALERRSAEGKCRHFTVDEISLYLYAFDYAEMKKQGENNDDEIQELLEEVWNFKSPSWSTGVLIPKQYNEATKLVSPFKAAGGIKIVEGKDGALPLLLPKDK